MFTVPIPRALSVGSLVDSRCTGHLAFAFVSDVVSAANRAIMRREASSLAAAGGNATSMMSLSSALASHKTFVIVSESVRPTHWDEGQCLGAAAVTELSPDG